jgi:hypothetical protein
VELQDYNVTMYLNVFIEKLVVSQRWEGHPHKISSMG